ncbi:hypothetical protein AGMMS50239_25330 [Bacteroidia bacterium]|nr:hypothetical protein AGMMS50239_25250 [Bacteroidia bacterium]GHT65479.1 hypothetical protein AGMMS50239_25330 [Bacteroidia bacterium]
MCLVLLLRRIVRIFCNEKEVKLILFNTPVYQVDKYTDQAKFDSLRIAILPDVDYMDFSDFLLPDSCYGDIGHLNYHGAEIFSEYLQHNF